MIQLAWISRGRTETTISPAAAAAERKRDGWLMVALGCAAGAGRRPRGRRRISTCAARPTRAVPVPPHDRRPERAGHQHLARRPHRSRSSPSPTRRAPSSLFVRPVGAVTSRKLAGTDDAAQPFWSPDSRSSRSSIGGKLKKVDGRGRRVEGHHATRKDFSGGAWSPRAAARSCSAPRRDCSRVSAEGGTAASSRARPGRNRPLLAELPARRASLTCIWRGRRTPRIARSIVGALDSKDKTRLMAAESNAVYAASTAHGRRPVHLLSSRGDAVRAAVRREDARVHRRSGPGRRRRGGRRERPRPFDVSQNGALIYFQGAGGGGPTGRGGIATAQFGFVDRTGGRVEIGGRDRAVRRHGPVAGRHADRRHEAGSGRADRGHLGGRLAEGEVVPPDDRSGRRHQSGLVAGRQADRVHVVAERQRGHLRQERQRRRRGDAAPRVADE